VSGSSASLRPECFCHVGDVLVDKKNRQKWDDSEQHFVPVCAFAPSVYSFLDGHTKDVSTTATRVTTETQKDDSKNLLETYSTLWCILVIL